MAKDEISIEIAEVLATLKRELVHAQERFREAGDGGREGALEALRALVNFVDCFCDDEISDLLQPVYELGLAISQRGNGLRDHPMLAAPPSTRGRPSDRREWNAAKALASLAVSILLNDKSDDGARNYVACELTKAGFTQSNGHPITDATVRTWRQDAMQGDVGADGSVAAFYREYQTLPAPPDGFSAQAHADQIIARVREMFAHLRV